jgi:hypothetical protein
MPDHELESNLLPETPEVGQETAAETQVETPEQQGSLDVEQQLEQEAPVQAPEVHEEPSVAVQAALPKDDLLVEIEEVLAEDLTDIYLNLPEEKRPLFREKGEKVAHQIQQMLTSGKAKAKHILSIILDWLRMIPGVNRFYLEKSAEIKTRRLILDYQASAQVNAI